MTRSREWLRPQFAAPRWSQLLRLSAAFAILCAAFLVASAHPARGGIDVWTSLGPPGDVFTLLIDPITPQTLYAAPFSGGVFKSTNGGSTWNAFNTGLHANVRALAIDPVDPRRVYAVTDGFGVSAIAQISACVGDCDGRGSVTVDGIITLVNIALGATSIAECGSGDANGDSEITVNEILAAVNNALSGCPSGQ